MSHRISEIKLKLEQTYENPSKHATEGKQFKEQDYMNTEVMHL